MLPSIWNNPYSYIYVISFHHESRTQRSKDWDLSFDRLDMWLLIANHINLLVYERIESGTEWGATPLWKSRPSRPIRTMGKNGFAIWSSWQASICNTDNNDDLSWRFVSTWYCMVSFLSLYLWKLISIEMSTMVHRSRTKNDRDGPKRRRCRSSEDESIGTTPEGNG